MKFAIASIFAVFLSSATSMGCGPGSVADSHHMCIRPNYIEGCDSYKSQTMCSECNYNYKLELNGLCSFDPSSSEPCCLKSGASGCQKCNRGLSLVNGSCVQVPVVGCLEKKEDGKCRNCASDGTCKKGIKFCQFYQDKDLKTCQKCLPSYSLARCKKEVNHRCMQCYKPFKVENNHCVIDNCKAYNDFGCESCECGFYITKKNQCKQIEDGCVRYQKGICTDCYPPYTLQGMSCAIDGCQSVENSICKRCKEGYKLADGGCKLPHCIQGSNGECQICEEGFSYVKGKCEQSNQKSIFMA